MLEIITLTLSDSLLVSGQLWFVLALIAYQWIDYGKIIDFFMTSGESLVSAQQEQKRRTGKAKSATVSVDMKDASDCDD